MENRESFKKTVTGQHFVQLTGNRFFFTIIFLNLLRQTSKYQRIKKKIIKKIDDLRKHNKVTKKKFKISNKNVVYVPRSLMFLIMELEVPGANIYLHTLNSI